MQTVESTNLVTSRRDLLEKELEAIYKVSKILGQSLDLNKTLSDVLQILNDDLGLSRGCFDYCQRHISRDANGPRCF